MTPEPRTDIPARWLRILIDAGEYKLAEELRRELTRKDAS